MTASEPALLHAAVMDRIRELQAARAIVRGRRADWTPGRWAMETEFRSLVRLVRQARKDAETAAAQDAVWRTTMLTRPEPIPDLVRQNPDGTVSVWVDDAPFIEGEPEQIDPITAAKSFHDWQAAAPDVDKVWTEAEMNYAAGR